MNPWSVGVIAALVAVPVALLLRSRLRTATHRRDEELDHPARAHLWVVFALPLLALLVGRAVADAHGAAVAFAYCLCLPALVALAAIDLDVHRLPNVLTYPLVPLAALIAGFCSLVGGHWSALGRALLAGVALSAAYLVLLVVSRGGAGLGLGDVKLAAGLGILLGWFSWSSVLGATLTGFVLGGLWAAVLLLLRRATRSTYIAFGPFMIGGTVLAFLAS